MTRSASFITDWAADVAERIVGDIPHAVFVRWAADVPERIAIALRAELGEVHRERDINVFVEDIVRALPDYLPNPTTARLRAKLHGALMTAGAIGRYLRTSEQAENDEPLEEEFEP